ncbi:immunoglobulin lambda-1 light chain-like [Ctenopharyngodon idella]|uniref:immunoglobulin lambda-1 light chain-like n=1 Tax=Ctenopharyngodon idella TaxID=7959 RepID=UPI00222E1BEF|nr:immunoglobulin lambda-1 light chain-like [Ctenopharyngodon idella]
MVSSGKRLTDLSGRSQCLDAGPTVKPSVSLLPPSSLQISGDSAALLCLLSSYSPQGALVSWTLDGSEVTEGVVTSAESQRDGRYSRSSVLTLSKARWEKGEVYVCRIVSLWYTFGGGTKLVLAGPTVKPSVSLLPPSSLQISGDSAALLCLLSSYSPQGALVSWTLDGSEVTEGVVTSAESQRDGRYSRSSVLTLSKARWEKGEVYVCRVTHDGAPHEVSFHKSSEC